LGRFERTFGKTWELPNQGSTPASRTTSHLAMTASLILAASSLASSVKQDRY
jgi:hypothetical protein